MKNIKLVLEYDGTNYHGWQSQTGSGRATVQETLELALRQITHEDSRTIASGRTDAGVHALGQVVNFRSGSSLPVKAWAPALNHLLPGDIRVISSEEAAPEFHARYSAQGKVYRYRILNRRQPSALYRHYAWHINLPLDLEKVRKASSCLHGTHDFSAFRGSGCTAKSPVRTLKRVEIDQEGDFVNLWFEADSFLQYMVRNITGTLVEAGLGRFSPEEIKEILQSCDRTQAGRTAPPQGLFLITVYYNARQLL